MVSKDHAEKDKNVEIKWPRFPSDARVLHRSLFEDQAFLVEEQEPVKRRDEPPLFLATCLAYPSEMRFAWVSDVQMRQREVKLFGADISSVLDDFVPSFERDAMEEEFDWAVYLSVVSAFDKLNAAEESKPDPSYLRFLIHTGDAMDGGFIQELWQFLAITNTSRMPWFNVIGNHDGSVFGNFFNKMTFTKEAFSDFFPVAGISPFMGMHSSDLDVAGEFFGHLPRPLGADADETVTGEITLEKVTEEGWHSRYESTPGSRCHGFDMDGLSDKAGPCSQQSGYYSFEMNTNTVIVVLESPRVSTWGEWAKWKFQEARESDSAAERLEAETTAKQLAWLAETLGKYAHRTILVFSHHRLDEDKHDALKKLLDQAAKKNAIAVFTGHTHYDDLTRYPDDRTKEPNYYDINLASIISYPQMGRVIEIRRDRDSGKGCLISKPMITSPFREALAIASPRGSLPAVDAELEKCEQQRSFVRDQDASNRMVECDDPSEACNHYFDQLRAGLRDAIRCGHLGAMRDLIKRKGAVPPLNTEDTRFAIPLDIPR